MDTLTWMLFWGAVAVAYGSAIDSSHEECESKQFTTSGECCKVCPPGEGVLTPCGNSQTVCSQCIDSETYSGSYSVTEKCKNCTECKGLMIMDMPCTESNDAICKCDYGFYLNSVSGLCDPCTVCPPGQGVFLRCESKHDTVCETCENNTYFSDQDSSLDPCIACTICEEEDAIEIKKCSPTADAVCFDPNAPTVTTPIFQPSTYPDKDDFYSPGPDEDSTTTKPSSPRFIGNGFNENLIPIYCSTLAAVLVGLLAYIVFKRWNSCKQNKQAANNRAATANQTSPSPEGEKLHSDSGISVDSQSLQEQQQTQAEAHTNPQTKLHVPEHIVVRVDSGAQPDSPPSHA